MDFIDNGSDNDKSIKFTIGERAFLGFGLCSIAIFLVISAWQLALVVQALRL